MRNITTPRFIRRSIPLTEKSQHEQRARTHRVRARCSYSAYLFFISVCVIACLSVVTAFLLNFHGVHVYFERFSFFRLILSWD